jgi:hypothetical protein
MYLHLLDESSNHLREMGYNARTKENMLENGGST